MVDYLLKFVPDAILIFGLLLVSIGFFLFHPALGFVITGIELCLFARLIDTDESGQNEPDT